MAKNVTSLKAVRDKKEQCSKQAALSGEHPLKIIFSIGGKSIRGISFSDNGVSLYDGDRWKWQEEDEFYFIERRFLQNQIKCKLHILSLYQLWVIERLIYALPMFLNSIGSQERR